MPANPGKTTATEGAWVTADGRSGDDCPPESHVHGSCRFQELAEGISGSAGGPTQGPGSHGASENAEGPPSRAALPCLAREPCGPVVYSSSGGAPSPKPKSAS